MTSTLASPVWGDASTLSPRRSKSARREAWLQTVALQLEQTFPLDIGNHERLYVWLDES